MLKRYFAKNFPRIYFSFKAFRRLILNQKSFLHQSGYWHTFTTGRPETPDGNPLPWINFNAIAFLNRRLDKSLSLFEYGSGFSTLYYAARVKQVFSVEHDRGWYEKLKDKIPANVQLIHVPFDVNNQYCRAIKSFGEKFDVIIIDGRDRNHCAIQALDNIKHNGVIIFDDSLRDKYAETLEFLLQKGFKRIDFEGLKPTSAGLTQTTIFYRQENCLNI